MDVMGRQVTEKKYEFTGETKELNGRTLHRIRAIRDFRNVKEGNLGGWIEKEENLSHEGNCWVANEACVFDDARVRDNSYVGGRARIENQAYVGGVVCIVDQAYVGGKACIVGEAIVGGEAFIAGDACITERAFIAGKAIITSTDDYTEKNALPEMKIWEAIMNERQRQNRLHPQWHGNDHGLVVLAEEFGEVAKALYELKQEWNVENYRELKDELVQVAAVCVRWLENIEEGVGKIESSESGERT